MLEFVPECLHCEGKPSLETYFCDCDKNDWTNEYRCVEISLQSDHLQDILSESFRNYDLHNSKGILQYKGLPNLSDEVQLSQPVGGTELFKLPLFNDSATLNVFVKNEGANPSGCFKDRETVSCWLHANRTERRKAVIYSSGNAAASAAWICYEMGLELIALVPGDTYVEKIEFIREYEGDVIKVGDHKTTFEQGYSLYAEMASSGYFINLGFDDWSVRNPFRIEGDKTIAVEIVKQFEEIQFKSKVPDFVVIPTANGSCLTGVWKGFNELKDASVIDNLPKMVSVGIKSGSPIFKAVRKDIRKQPAIRSMDDLDEKDESLGSIILAEEGYDSIEAASAVRASNGFALELKSEDIEKAYNGLISKYKLLMNRQDFLPEPASALSIAAVEKLVNEHDIHNEASIVCLITGHGMNSKEKLYSLLENSKGVKGIINPIINRKRSKVPESSETKGSLLQSQVNLESLKEAFTQLMNSK